MKRKSLYLALCVAGLALPYWQFLPWAWEHGLDLPLVAKELFANRIGGFFGMDVLVSAAVTILFVRLEGARLGIGRLWLPVAALLTVGVSLALPLFLYLRETKLEETAGYNAVAR